jgi:hypothetical protein
MQISFYVVNAIESELTPPNSPSLHASSNRSDA